MKIAFAKPQLPTEGAVVVGVLEGKALTATAQKLDGVTGGALTRALATGRFDGKRDQTLTILAPTGLDASRILLVGLGKPEALDALVASQIDAGVVDRGTLAEVEREVKVAEAAGPSELPAAWGMPANVVTA